MAELKDLPAETRDGVRINLYINVGLAFDLDYIETTNCDGIGLYRTEIPFMASDVMPDVDRQMSYYKELMDRAGDKRVISARWMSGRISFCPIGATPEKTTLPSAGAPFASRWTVGPFCASKCGLFSVRRLEKSSMLCFP